MRVDLRRLEIDMVVILPFTGQHPIDAIVNIGADYQRILDVAFPHLLFFFVQDIDETVLSQWLASALACQSTSLAFDEMHVVLLRAGILRTHAPPAVFPWFGGIGTGQSVLIQMDHIQPGSRIVVL